MSKRNRDVKEEEASPGKEKGKAAQTGNSNSHSPEVKKNFQKQIEVMEEKSERDQSEAAADESVEIPHYRDSIEVPRRRAAGVSDFASPIADLSKAGPSQRSSIEDSDKDDEYTTINGEDDRKDDKELAAADTIYSNFNGAASEM